MPPNLDLFSFIDNAFLIIIGIAILGGLIKVGFWIFIFLGISKSYGASAQQFDPISQLLGIHPPEQTRAQLDGHHHRRYANRGFILGSICIILGMLLIVSGFGEGEIELTLLDMSINRAGPGTVIAFIGAFIIKTTQYKDR